MSNEQPFFVSILQFLWCLMEFKFPDCYVCLFVVYLSFWVFLSRDSSWSLKMEMLLVLPLWPQSFHTDMHGPQRMDLNEFVDDFLHSEASRLVFADPVKYLTCIRWSAWKLVSNMVPWWCILQLRNSRMTFSIHSHMIQQLYLVPVFIQANASLRRR